MRALIFDLDGTLVDTVYRARNRLATGAHRGEPADSMRGACIVASA